MNRTIVRNFLSLSGAEAIGKVLTFLAFAYLARQFGAARYGMIEWAAALLMCASLIVDQGFSSYGAREIAKFPDRTAKLVSQIVTARFALSAAAYAGLAAFATLYIDDAAVANLVLIYGMSLWILPLLLQWVFQGHDRMHLVSATQVVRQAVFAGVIFLFVAGADDLAIVGIAEIAAVGAAAGLGLLFYGAVFPQHLDLKPTISVEGLRSSAVIGLSQLFWVLKMFGATVIVGIVATPTDTGVFGGAMRIFIAAHTFVWIYFFNLLPSLSRSWQNDRNEFIRLQRSSMRLILLTGTAALAAGLVFAPNVMTTVYGPEFLIGAATLRALAAACLLAAFSGHYRFGLIAAGKQNLEMLSSAAGALAALILIPAGYYWDGITGAGLGLLVAEAVILVLSGIFAEFRLFRQETAVTGADDRILQGIPAR